ncbi:carboxylesterase/lipase family protein [Mycolicibacterium sp. P9-64]|uniref:carboxylesterase/lipase family protein n=1 Tax=Mycolicibacterium sp. P9-64 TaxID=2024612 RepID=UPI0011ED6851|nr:carboxylesterase family protein [Mycolicibacterium sp. P9-64]KAA0080055.1 carboxylesterase/lipase family protein [Mycolicibacterium sp. P9-64]
MTPVVATRSGRVRGAAGNGVSVFRGIPYAQPPVGSLRFAAPVPHDAWDGVRDALEFDSPPPQPDRITSTDEWLTANVWTPSTHPPVASLAQSTEATRLPVMVWIHGGRFTSGSGAEPEYDGSHLAARGAVVVTINYRVGVEGFMLIDGAPPNRGLLDQIAGLRWVNENIASFGGDPANVTVFGESAGAASVALLMCAPPAVGLLHRGIAESVPAVMFGVDLAGDIAGMVARRVGRGPTLADLAAVPAPDLVLAATEVEASAPGHEDRWGYGRAVRGAIFGPVVDGTVVPASPWQAMAAGAARGVDLLVGHNRDEYNIVIAGAGGPQSVTEAASERALRTLPPRPSAAKEYRAAHPGADHAELYQLVCSDFVYRMPTLHLAQAHTASGGRTYLYEFCWDATPIGAAHTVEIPAVFGTLGSPYGAQLYGTPPPAKAVALSDDMGRAWQSFAQNGDPGWPQYDATGQLTRVFGAESTVARYPEQVSQAIWAGYEFEPFPLQVSD